MPSETQWMEPVYQPPENQFNNRLVYDRFKYAEEATKRLDDQKFPWVMFRDADRVEVEEYGDGDVETYTFPQYVVLWNE